MAIRRMPVAGMRPESKGRGARMARRQARFTAQDLADDPRLRDHSPELWRPELGEVQRRLLSSAVRCFAANGFHATTTRDIAEGVGLSPAALYVHFPSKELVLYEIIRVGHERVLAHVQDPSIVGSGSSADRLRAIVAAYTVWHARHHVTARVCQMELNGLTAEHYAEIVEVRHRTNAYFRGAVARGVADGTFAQVDVERITRAMLSLSIDLVRWYRLDGADSPEQLGDFYADLALRLVTGPRD
ncbi:TetR/AcrR family transcriptional regulator [Nonomuraea glycinis]|uniref:TetR family transcriptional regulator n=1 Tax=Nonomuraea glycinis TaxID=2047744 RepID=A0A918E3N1_9ACTN|nr:TetR/AcrR family transcriptional regulator [Nonomuraea glycinis]MCA2174753.1 TetR/AcrR family transcriptional regulator [Nonomuraea glycinis]GGP01737.1 TetR family transcriptional regulator [Nonomuraea glycinis]